MLHGVTPDKHGYHNERAGAERFPLDSAYPSFFRLAREGTRSGRSFGRQPDHESNRTPIWKA
ncbi:hypothetical protein J6TS7_52970 [Paenibacillus dendritiformis]|nr:hypothetical protein J6TS7_52970 [Paenibacillus dendritiformis]